VQTIQLDVPTVHCRSCKLNIEESLEELGGVESSEVDVDTKRVEVTFDPAVVDTPAVIAAIEEAGYPVSR
jgi:copper chaperone CopZ